jgi:hypothetical protein
MQNVDVEKVWVALLSAIGPGTNSGDAEASKPADPPPPTEQAAPKPPAEPDTAQTGAADDEGEFRYVTEEYCIERRDSTSRISVRAGDCYGTSAVEVAVYEHSKTESTPHVSSRKFAYYNYHASYTEDAASVLDDVLADIPRKHRENIIRSARLIAMDNKHSCRFTVPIRHR